MVWTPPTKPDPGIAKPDQIVSQDIELAGAAYRVQAGRPNTSDSQTPYYEGFVRYRDAYGQTDINVPHSAVGISSPMPPPDKDPGSMRPRVSKDDAPVGRKADRRNVLGGQETTGEAPAPLFTQAVGRSSK